jgi:hypothetical protein
MLTAVSVGTWVYVLMGVALILISFTIRRHP